MLTTLATACLEEMSLWESPCSFSTVRSSALRQSRWFLLGGGSWRSVSSSSLVRVSRWWRGSVMCSQHWTGAIVYMSKARMMTLHLGEVVAVVLTQPAEPLGPGELGAPLGEREQEFTW